MSGYFYYTICVLYLRKGGGITVENTLKQILEELQNLNKKVDRLEVEQQEMKAEQQEMKVELREMKAEQQSIKSMLITQGDHIQQLIQIVGATNAQINQIKEDISEMKNTQLEHQRALERLSFRSITQEAAINDLRRIK